MAATSKVRNDSVYQNLFKVVPTRAQEQQIKIIEAAIKSFVNQGIQNTTYASLAKACKVSRPLVHHYYPSFDDLIRAAAVYVRAIMQDHAIQATQAGGPKAQDQLSSYIKSCFTWIHKYPEHYRFWLLFFYQCGIDEKARAEHTNLTAMGQDRIAALIELGNGNAEWKVKDIAKISKAIQCSISGTMMVVMTEDSKLTLQELEKMVMAQSLLMIKNGL